MALDRGTVQNFPYRTLHQLTIVVILAYCPYELSISDVSFKKCSCIIKNSSLLTTMFSSSRYTITLTVSSDRGNSVFEHEYNYVVEINIILLRILIVLLHSKHCSSELSVRVGLTVAAISAATMCCICAPDV